MFNKIRLGIWRAISPSKYAWRSASRALWLIAAIGLVVSGAGMVAPNFSPEKAYGFLATVAFLSFAGLAAFLLLILIGKISWRAKLAILAGAPLTLLIILFSYGFPGGLAAVGILLVSTIMLAGGFGAAARPGRAVAGRIAPSIFGLAGLTGFVFIAYALFALNKEPNAWLAEYSLKDKTLALADPGAPGRNEIETFAYGNGEDRRREEYGAAADWTSRSVDGSRLIEGWDGPTGWARTRYWGFDTTALPIQGRVWAPAGNGPFPLVLVVHGNHSMEDFSDPGYAYLGEHLASRGFIIVSVDENFLNGSIADRVNPIKGGLKEENDARAWVLLEHLKQWRQWSVTPDHPFSGRVDMSRIGLIGHSRGGEAVATAAVFNQLGSYPDDATFPFDYGFDIGAVIAIAPVDGQYRPRKSKRPIHNANYFVIHGGMDGDVQSFMGSSQYSRISFSGDEFRFKANLHIAGANHGQFNTSWGAEDLPFPMSLFLDKSGIMSAEDQRKIAKVYFTAFLDSALNDATEYLPIFADPAYAAKWLPEALLTANYQDSEFQSIADYELDLDPVTTAVEGAAIYGEALTVWREESIQLKWNTLDTHAALIAWDDEVNPEIASYVIEFERPYDRHDADEAALSFAAAQANISTKPKDWETPKENNATGNELKTAGNDDESSGEDISEETKPLDWSIVLVDAGGHKARARLSAQTALPPQSRSNIMRAMKFSSEADSEVVMRRYTFPLSTFDGDEIDPRAIKEIRFEFDKSLAGAVYLDDIGFSIDRL